MLHQCDELNFSRIEAATSVTRRTVGRIAKAIRNRDNLSLQKLLDPIEHRAGTRFVPMLYEENRSITKAILAQYMEYFNRNVRRIIDSSAHAVLLLDSSKSRKGLESVELGFKFNSFIA